MSVVMHFLLPFTAFFVLGLILRSLTAILVGVLLWPLLLVGIVLGVLNDGVLGDGWQPVVLTLSASSAVGAVTGVAIGRAWLGRVE